MPCGKSTKVPDCYHVGTVPDCNHLETLLIRLLPLIPAYDCTHHLLMFVIDFQQDDNLHYVSAQQQRQLCDN